MIGWRNVPSHLWTVKIVKGVYEISPVSQKWDKEGPFNETIYFHMLNTEYSALQDLEESRT